MSPLGVIGGRIARALVSYCGRLPHEDDPATGKLIKRDVLQTQGVIAEYERAQILERERRGRRHAARSGPVSALAGAPYGYRYVTRERGGGVARFEVVPEEARFVRLIFA